MAHAQKLLAIAGGTAAIVALSAWAWHGRGDSTQYRTAPVEFGDLAYAVSATGTPNAVVTVQVGSQVSGNVMALYADFNTRVTKDQVVARIDPQIFQQRVDQAKAALSSSQFAVVNAQAQIQKNQADVESARASVADAQANVVKAQSAVNDAKTKLDRRIELVKDGILATEDGDTAQATYDQAVASLNAAQAQLRAANGNVTASQAQVRVAQTQLDSTQAQVKQAEASLAQSQTDLDHTYIRAPVDGVVVARNVDVGQTVAASLQAPTLFQIAQDLAKMQVDTNVSEADVGRVKVGQPATFTVDAYPGQVFRGSVAAIRKAPINVQNVVTYDVVISVSNEDLKLFPGMTATVKILIDQHQNVLKLPNAAFRFRPAAAGKAPSPAPGRKGSGGQQVVWVFDAKGQPKAVPVTTGITDGASTEITGGGLHQGDRVIVAALSKAQGSSAAASPFGSASSGGGRRGAGF